MNTPPFPAISSPVFRHPAILRINLGGTRRTKVTSTAYSTSTFSKHANPPKRRHYLNLIDEENKKASQPVEAEALPGNQMDDAVMRVIARVEQTLGAWRFSVADQDRHVSADRLQLAAQHDRWRAAEQARRVRADRLRLTARRDHWSATEREARCAAQQQRIHRGLPAVGRASQLGT